MECWSWHTESSLLEGDEVLLTSQTGVGLYDGDRKTRWNKGKLMLTTHRLVYVDLESGGGGSTLYLPLEQVHRAGSSPSTSAGFAFSSDKIVVPLPAGRYARIAFREGGMKDFYEALLRALRTQAWRQAPAAAPARSSPAPAAPVAGRASEGGPRATAGMLGIAGIMRASEQRSQMPDTFKDIDDVMAKASSLVASIRQLKDRASASDQAAQDEAAIESIEATLGLGTMVVTKSAAGGGAPRLVSQRRFHEELGAELHAWMVHPRNERVFGEMPFVPLIELFAMYNRARSGDLVSPADVLHACKAMTRSGPGSLSAYTLEELSSGRMALVSTDDSMVLAKLVALLGPMLASPAHAKVCRVPVGRRTIATSDALPASAAQLRAANEVQLASALRVVVPVARDVLQKLTTQGYLCMSDAGYGCATYYWNVFAV